MSLSTTVKFIQHIRRARLLNRLGTPVGLVHALGGRETYLQAARELDTELYQEGD